MEARNELSLPDLKVHTKVVEIATGLSGTISAVSYKGTELINFTVTYSDDHVDSCSFKNRGRFRLQHHTQPETTRRQNGRRK